MAHKRTVQSVPDEPEPSHGDAQEQETVHTDEPERAIEEAFHISEARLQAALQLAQANYAQLERTKSQLRAIIDASQEAMLFLSPGGRPLKVNMRFTDFFGLDDTTVLSQSADELTALLKGLFVDAVLLDRSPTWGTTDQEHIFREQQVQVGPERREFDFASLPVMNVDQTYIGRLYVWHDATHEREVELHRKPLDIALLIRELLPSFQPGWDARQQTFTLHLPEKAPMVLADADRLMQILSNLLSNAPKYTPDEGHIDLSVEIAEPVAHVEVTDSGIGLSTEEQAKLFTRFYQAHNPAAEAV